MIARRTLLQLTTKLAIGFGALFLVGVLLAAIPNHRPPMVEGTSAQARQETQVGDPAPVKSAKTNMANPQEKHAVQGVEHTRTTAPKVGESTR